MVPAATAIDLGLGDGNRADINSTFFQPFLSKGLGRGRTAPINRESSYDWKGAKWNVPLKVGCSVVSKIGTQLVSYYGGVRFTFTLLFPKK